MVLGKLPVPGRPTSLDKSRAMLVGWLVVLGLTALLDSISVHIGPSPKEGEEKRKDRREKKCPNNPHPHLLQAH